MIGRLWRRRDRREIFPFKVDGRTRYADPLAVRRAMDAANPNWLSVTQVAGVRPVEGMTPEEALDVVRTASGAVGELCKVVQAGFGVKAFDGVSGLTEREQMDLLVRYLNWMTEAKELASFFPTSPRSTASAEGDSTTEPRLDFGSTKTDTTSESA